MNEQKKLLLSVIDEIIILAKEMQENAIHCVLVTLRSSIIRSEDDLSRLAQTCNGFCIIAMIKNGVDPIKEINKVKEEIKKANKN